jgi:hypothetical protein
MRLESENRFFRPAAAGVALVAAALVFMGAVRSPPIIEAERIVLPDSKVRARVIGCQPRFAGPSDMKP